MILPGVNFSFDLLADGTIALTIDGRCIKTVATGAYRELSGLMLEDSVSEEVASDRRLSGALDLLAEFLNTSDFSRLRAIYPALNGSRPCRVRVYRDADGMACWEFHGAS